MAEHLVVMDAGRVVDAGRSICSITSRASCAPPSWWAFPAATCCTGEWKAAAASPAWAAFPATLEAQGGSEPGGSELAVVIRPEQIACADSTAPGAAPTPGEIRLVENLGAECVVHFVAGEETLVTTVPSRSGADLDLGAAFPFFLRPDGILLFDRVSGAPVGTAAMPDIRLSGLTRRFGAVTAVDDVTMTFAEGTVTCLLGPSGCGKTTLMRMIAGLETPGSGRVIFGDRDVTSLPPRRRDVGMVFQYPVMYRTLYGAAEHRNCTWPRPALLAPATAGAGSRRCWRCWPSGRTATCAWRQLDSGTRQKVAVGRAIARSCDVILFDEPTTNLEVHAKLQLIRAFKEFRTRFRQTIIYVTHDQTEAMTLADRIALMQRRRDHASAARRTMLYDRPDSEFGGWFLGNPGNELPDPGRRRRRLGVRCLPAAARGSRGGSGGAARRHPSRIRSPSPGGHSGHCAGNLAAKHHHHRRPITAHPRGRGVPHQGKGGAATGRLASRPLRSRVPVGARGVLSRRQPIVRAAASVGGQGAGPGLVGPSVAWTFRVIASEASSRFDRGRALDCLVASHLAVPRNFDRDTIHRAASRTAQPDTSPRRPA